MSYWTHINGTIEVMPMGRTQAEKRYILETVLEHLPIVTGSEENMHVHIIQRAGTNCSSFHDEFGYSTNNLKDRYGHQTRRNGWLRTQDNYILIVEGDFRDRIFKETYVEFQKWLCRLAKRVMVRDVLVKITEYKKSSIITNKHGQYLNMFESPSWVKEGSESNWCEYLMWEKDRDCSSPLLWVYKYFNNEEVDEEIKRRKAYQKLD